MKVVVAVFHFFLFSVNICLAQQTRLGLPFSHTKDINTARFSNDGKLVLTASKDSTAIVWDVLTGNQLYTLRGHRMDVQIARTSYDEQYIVTGSSDSTAIIWDQNTGDSIQIITHPDSVVNVFFLREDNELITQTKDSIFSWVRKGKTWLSNTRAKGLVNIFGKNDYLYDNENGLFLYSNKRHLFITEKLKYWAYMSPQKYIVTSEDTGYIKLYSKQDGKFIRQIKLAAIGERLLPPDFDKTESSMAYFASHTVKNALGENRLETQDSLSILNLNSGKIVKYYLNFSNGGRVSYIGTDTVMIYSEDSWSSSTLIYCISKDSSIKYFDGSWPKISFDRRTVLTVDGEKAIVNNLYNGASALLQTTALESSFFVNDSLLQTKFSSQKTTAFTWQYRRNVFILEKDTSKRIIDNELYSSYDLSKYLTSLSMPLNNNESKKYSLKVDKQYFTIQNEKGRLIFSDSTGRIKKIKLHEGSNTFVTLDNRNVLNVFSLETGNKLLTLNKNLKGLTNQGGAQGISSFSINEIYSQTFEKNGIIFTDHFYNNSGTHFYEIISIPTKNGNVLDHFYVWSIEGKLVGKFNRAQEFGKYPVAFENGKLIVFNADYTEKILSLPLTNYVIKAKRYDDKLLLVYEDYIEIRDIATGNLQKKILGIKMGENIFYDSVRKQFVDFYPKKILLYNEDFKIVRTITVKNLTLGSRFKFVKNNELLLLKSDTYLTVFSLRSNRYFHLFFPNENNWIVLDENGNFDGTEDARKTLYLTCGTEVISLEQVKDQLWVPNLAERIIKGEAINAKKLDELNICGFTPEVENAIANSGEYSFRIKSRKGGLGETVLLVNGIEAKRYKPEELKKNGTWYELVIKKEALQNFFIAGKENPVTLKAYTQDNGISSRGVIVLEDKTKQVAKPANLYAVMVGVSDYKGTELDLKYAAKDATDLSGAIAAAAKKLLNVDGKEHVFMYNLTTSNDNYLLPEKNAIKNVLEEISKKATANDILFIFFAGHGVMDDESKKFYFLTADASKASAVSSIADVGISTTELTEWMKPQNIQAQKRILIFDACNSGQAIKDFVKMGSSDQNYIAARNDENAQQIKAIDKLNEKSGLFILSASSSNQSAYEMGKYSQGLLTYALLKAIKQQPDILEQGKYLDLSRWFNAAEKTVSDISKESGARQEPQIVSNTNFSIGIIDEDVLSKIILSNEKPSFTTSNFQNFDREVADDDLELSKEINRYLNDIASRGVESSIVYNPSVNAKDVFTLTGGYDVRGESVSITVNVKQNKILITRFELSGPKEQLQELAMKIANQATSIVKNL